MKPRFTPKPPPAAPPAPRPDWVGAAPVAVELDVRPMLARGEEPFSTIIDAAGRIAPGAVLLLVAPFDPAPLYKALGRLGFESWTDCRGLTDFAVYFRRAPQTAPRVSAPTLDWSATPTVVIDVSGLPPPEPMVKILEELAALPAGSTLLMEHVRRPLHLYDRLDEMGCRHMTRELAPERIQVLIQKP